MIKRHAERDLKELGKIFSSVLVTGARQVGKTTLLTEYGKKFDYLTFDNPFFEKRIKWKWREFYWKIQIATYFWWGAVCTRDISLYKN